MFVGRDEIVGDLTHKSRKGKLAEQQIGGFLVLADLAQRYGSRFEASLLSDMTCDERKRGDSEI